MIVYICLYFYLKKICIKLGVIILIAIWVWLPTLLWLYNLATNSKNLSSDYWNTVVLTQIPLDRQKTQNTLLNVVAWYNGDTKYATYGYLNDKEYQPWWFARYTDDLISFVAYIPFFLLILSLIFFRNKSSKEIYIWLWFLVFLLFIMKSSSWPGGQYFYDVMMNSGIMKMFRSPHAKFGFEYMVTICMILSIWYQEIKSMFLKRSIMGMLMIYIVVFFIYPVASHQYIPPLQLSPGIPTEYTSVKNYLMSRAIQLRQYL